MMQLKLKQVPKSYKPREGRGVVYAITHPWVNEDLNELVMNLVLEDNTYVGVTGGSIAQRWRDHKALRARDNQLTSRFIKKHGYDYEQCFRIIFEGTIDQCYRLEYHLRSEPNMGLNKKVGGKLSHRKFNRRYADMIESITP